VNNNKVYTTIQILFRNFNALSLGGYYRCALVYKIFTQPQLNICKQYYSGDLNYGTA